MRSTADLIDCRLWPKPKKWVAHRHDGVKRAPLDRSVVPFLTINAENMPWQRKGGSKDGGQKGGAPLQA